MVQQLVQREMYIKALVYGMPGAGKTTLASTAVDHPRMRDVLFLSIEGGLLSVPSNPHIWVEEIRNNPDAAGLPSGSALARVEKMLWDLAAKGTPNFNKSWCKDINTVVIDSGTELLTLALENIVKERKGDPDVIFLQDYGRSTSSLKRLFRFFRDLPYNIVITALAQDVFDGKGETSRRVGIEPAFTSKLRESVKGVVDHVWYAYRNEADDTHHLLTRTQGICFAKTRGRNFAPALGQKVDHPNLAEIYELLLQSEGSQEVTTND